MFAEDYDDVAEPSSLNRPATINQPINQPTAPILTSSNTNLLDKTRYIVSIYKI